MRHHTTPETIAAAITRAVELTTAAIGAVFVIHLAARALAAIAGVGV